MKRSSQADMDDRTTFFVVAVVVSRTRNEDGHERNAYSRC